MIESVFHGLSILPGPREPRIVKRRDSEGVVEIYHSDGLLWMIINAEDYDSIVARAPVPR